MATWIDRLKAPKAGQKDFAAKFPGLHVRVFAGNRKVWYVRGRLKRATGEGTQRFVLLGEYPGVSEDQAEAEAAKARDMLRRGIDPALERDAQVRSSEAKSKTFAQVVEEWTAENRADWRPSTIAVRRSVFNGPRLAAIRDQRIGDISAADLKALAKTVKTNSMQSALGPVRSVFRFAVAQGYIPASPFTVKIQAAEGNAAPMIVFHEGRSPDFSELVAMSESLDAAEQSLPMSPWWNIWRVCILTGQRPSAVIGLRWSELSLDGDAPTWSLPAARSKIKRDAEIPLSKDCAALLREIPRGESALVWPGRDGKRELKYPIAEPKIISARLSERGFPVGWWAGRARDSVASWLEFQSDATERAMALLLGHKPPAKNTRQQHYAKIGAEHQARTLIERYAQAVRDARAGKVARVVSLRKGA